MNPRSLPAGVTLLAFLITQGISPSSALALRPSVEGVQSGLEQKLNPSAAGLEETALFDERVDGNLIVRDRGDAALLVFQAGEKTLTRLLETLQEKLWKQDPRWQRTFKISHIDVLTLRAEDEAVGITEFLESILREPLMNAADSVVGQHYPSLNLMEIRIRAFIQKGELRIEVVDNGPGISSEILSQLGKAEVSTKRSLDWTRGQSGHGILESTRKASEHGWRLTVTNHSDETKGAVAALVIPLTEPAKTPAAGLEEERYRLVTVSGKEHLLLVEDFSSWIGDGQEWRQLRLKSGVSKKGRTIGTVLLAWDLDPAGPEGHWVIQNLEVPGNFRGMGYSKILLEAAMEWTSQRGESLLRAEAVINPRMAHVLVSYGFSPTDIDIMPGAFLVALNLNSRFKKPRLFFLKSQESKFREWIRSALMPKDQAQFKLISSRTEDELRASGEPLLLPTDYVFSSSKNQPALIQSLKRFTSAGLEEGVNEEGARRLRKLMEQLELDPRRAGQLLGNLGYNRGMTVHYSWVEEWMSGVRQVPPEVLALLEEKIRKEPSAGLEERRYRLEGPSGPIEIGVDISPNTVAPAPVAFIFHGLTGSRNEPHILAVRKLLATMGYLVVAPDFRNHGLKNRNQSGGDLDQLTLPGQMEDLVRVIQFVREKIPGADLSRVILGGHSLGGWTAGQAAEEIALGTPGFEDIGVVAVAALSGILRPQELGLQNPQALGRFELYDPLENLRRIPNSVRYLYVVGEKDPRVSPGSDATQAFLKAVEARGIPPLVLPGVAHALAEQKGAPEGTLLAVLSHLGENIPTLGLLDEEFVGGEPILDDTSYSIFQVGGRILLPRKGQGWNSNWARMITRLDPDQLFIETHTMDRRGRTVFNTSTSDTIQQLARGGALYKPPLPKLVLLPATAGVEEGRGLAVRKRLLFVGRWLGILPRPVDVGRRDTIKQIATIGFWGPPASGTAPELNLDQQGRAGKAIHDLNVMKNDASQSHAKTLFSTEAESILNKLAQLSRERTALVDELGEPAVSSIDQAWQQLDDTLAGYATTPTRQLLLDGFRVARSTPEHVGIWREATISARILNHLGVPVDKRALYQRALAQAMEPDALRTQLVERYADSVPVVNVAARELAESGIDVGSEDLISALGRLLSSNPASDARSDQFWSDNPSIVLEAIPAQGSIAAWIQESAYDRFVAVVEDELRGRFGLSPRWTFERGIGYHETTVDEHLARVTPAEWGSRLREVGVQKVVGWRRDQIRETLREKIYGLQKAGRWPPHQAGNALRERLFERIDQMTATAIEGIKLSDVNKYVDAMVGSLASAEPSPVWIQTRKSPERTLHQWAALLSASALSESIVLQIGRVDGQWTVRWRNSPEQLFQILSPSSDLHQRLVSANWFGRLKHARYIIGIEQGVPTEQLERELSDDGKVWQLSTEDDGWVHYDIPRLIGLPAPAAGVEELTPEDIVGDHPFPVRRYSGPNRNVSYLRGGGIMFRFPSYGLNLLEDEVGEGTLGRMLSPLLPYLSQSADPRFAQARALQVMVESSPEELEWNLRQARVPEPVQRHLLEFKRGVLDAVGAVGPKKALWSAMKFLKNPLQPGGPAYGILVDSINHVLTNPGQNPRIRQTSAPIQSIEEIDPKKGIELWAVKEGEMTLVLQATVVLKDGRKVQFSINVAKDKTAATREMKTVFEALSFQYKFDPTYMMEIFKAGNIEELGVMIGEWGSGFHELHVYRETGTLVHVWEDQNEARGRPLSRTVSDAIWYKLLWLEAYYTHYLNGGALINFLNLNSGDLTGAPEKEGQREGPWKHLVIWERSGGSNDLYNPAQAPYFAIFKSLFEGAGTDESGWIWLDNPELAIQATVDGIRAHFDRVGELSGWPQARRDEEAQHLLDFILQRAHRDFPRVIKDPSLIFASWNQLPDSEKIRGLAILNRGYEALGRYLAQAGLEERRWEAVRKRLLFVGRWLGILPRPVDVGRRDTIKQIATIGFWGPPASGTAPELNLDQQGRIGNVIHELNVMKESANQSRGEISFSIEPDAVLNKLAQLSRERTALVDELGEPAVSGIDQAWIQFDDTLKGYATTSARRLWVNGFQVAMRTPERVPIWREATISARILNHLGVTVDNRALYQHALAQAMDPGALRTQLARQYADSVPAIRTAASEIAKRGIDVGSRELSDILASLLRSEPGSWDRSILFWSDNPATVLDAIRPRTFISIWQEKIEQAAFDQVLAAVESEVRDLYLGAPWHLELKDYRRVPLKEQSWLSGLTLTEWGSHLRELAVSQDTFIRKSRFSMGIYRRIRELERAGRWPPDQSMGDLLRHVDGMSASELETVEAKFDEAVAEMVEPLASASPNPDWVLSSISEEETGRQWAALLSASALSESIVLQIGRVDGQWTVRWRNSPEQLFQILSPLSDLYQRLVSEYWFENLPDPKEPRRLTGYLISIDQGISAERLEQELNDQSWLWQISPEDDGWVRYDIENLLRLPAPAAGPATNPSAGGLEERNSTAPDWSVYVSRVKRILYPASGSDLQTVRKYLDRFPRVTDVTLVDPVAFRRRRAAGDVFSVAHEIQGHLKEQLLKADFGETEIELLEKTGELDLPVLVQTLDGFRARQEVMFHFRLQDFLLDSFESEGSFDLTIVHYPGLDAYLSSEVPFWRQVIKRTRPLGLIVLENAYLPPKEIERKLIKLFVPAAIAKEPPDKYRTYIIPNDGTVLLYQKLPAAGLEEWELIAEETVAADAAELVGGFRVAAQANLQPGLVGRFGEARLVTVSNEPEQAARELAEIASDESVAAILLDRMQFLDEKKALRILPAEHGPAFLLFPSEAHLFTPAVAAALLKLQLPANRLLLLKLKQEELGIHLQLYA